MPGRKKIAEDTWKLQVMLPKPMRDYLERKVQAQGYGATVSSIVREMIHRDMMEAENAENRNR